jgi:acyl-CoA synthetase (AMP-forming)/AMP-acid ligase II
MSDLALATIQEAVAEIVPERPALVWGEATVSHAELTRRSRRFAATLVASRASWEPLLNSTPRWQSGQAHVGILMRNRPEWLEVMFGSFKARAVPFNINFRYTPDELSDVLLQAQPSCLVFESHYASLVEAVRSLLPNCLLVEVSDTGRTEIGGALHYENLVQSFAEGDVREAWTQDDRYMLFTGGTTGRPKGVLWRQKDLFVAALGGLDPRTGSELTLGDVLARIRSEPHSAVASPPLMHGAAQWFSLPVLFAGGCVVMPGNNETFDPDEVLATVANHRARMLLIVGDAHGRPLADAVDRSRYGLSNLKVIVSTAVVLSTDVQKSLMRAIPGVTIVNSAGSSETGAQLRSQVDAAQPADNVATFEALPGTVVLNDERLAAVQPGDPSAGWLARFGAVPLGYLGDPTKTLETFPEIDGVRYSIPGDRARLLPKGVIELLGRDNLMINTGGEKIFVEEVERVILRHPDVADVLVVGRPSKRWGEEVVGIIQSTDGAQVTTEEIREFASEWLARYKLPKDVIFVEEVRRSAAGKADYRWAKDLAKRDAAE